MNSLLQFYYDDKDRVLLNAHDANHLTNSDLDNFLPFGVKIKVFNYLTRNERNQFLYHTPFPEEEDEYFDHVENDLLLIDETDDEDENDYYDKYDDEAEYYQNLYEDYRRDEEYERRYGGYDDYYDYYD